MNVSGLGVLTLATPDIASLGVNGMLTSLLCQPAADAAGEAAPRVAIGGVASRRTVTERLAVPPAEVAVQVKVMPAVSVVTVLVPQPSLETREDWASVTSQSTS